MMMIYVRFVLDQHAELDFYSASSLKQQSTDRHVALLGQIILIPYLWVFTRAALVFNSPQSDLCVNVMKLLHK
jgi:hypothetical protein